MFLKFYCLVVLKPKFNPQFSSISSLSHVRLFATPWTAAPASSVHHQLTELTRTHFHRVSDAIQPSHPLSSPSPPAFNLSQHHSLFQGVSSLHPKLMSHLFLLHVCLFCSVLSIFELDFPEFQFFLHLLRLGFHTFIPLSISSTALSASSSSCRAGARRS